MFYNLCVINMPAMGTSFRFFGQNPVKNLCGCSTDFLVVAKLFVENDAGVFQIKYFYYRIIMRHLVHSLHCGFSRFQFSRVLAICLFYCIKMVLVISALCQIVLVENQNNKINKQLKSEKRFGLQSKPLLIWKH